MKRRSYYINASGLIARLFAALVFLLAVSVAFPAIPAGPVLVVSSASNPFSGYYAEILRTEGLVEFDVSDISSLSPSVLASHDIAILGEMPLTASQVTMLGDWVNGGGRLIAMRPDKKLAALLGLTGPSSTLSNAYILVNTASGPGQGIVNRTMQFHGTADRYGLGGASAVATLYSDSTTATTSPAVTLNNIGANGGQAAAFAYDLARSVVYTRQGNPAWAGQERDGTPPIRSDDLFFGAAGFDPQPDWIDLNKVAIPQADEQQRLLANLVIRMNAGRKPLPRFWYFPRSLPAVVVMTGDDHGNGGTAGRFDKYLSLSSSGCSVQNWQCIRGTSYIYTNTPLSNSQAATYDSAGFEVALHVNTDCADFTPSSLESFFTSQLGPWKTKYSRLSSPVTNRTHCIPWSDYVTQALVELNHGIRFDTNYYYWPPEWVGNRPGFFTGSGMPMRFADVNGNLIDVYQAPTQMTDESDQAYPLTIDTLLDRAAGADGFYGAFVVNAHTDTVASSVSDAVVNSAVARGIPVITSRQMLSWLDGRGASTFGSLTRDGNTLGFSIGVGQNANGLTAMVPVPEGLNAIGITHDGSSVPFSTVTVKGIQYASFGAASGSYLVSYDVDGTPPMIGGVSPANGASGVATGTNITAYFSEAIDPATINGGTFELRDSSGSLVPASVAYVAVSRTAALAPTASLANSMTYTAVIRGSENGVRDIAGNPLTNDFTWSFTTAAAPVGLFTIWPATTVPGVTDSGPDGAVELGVKFRADISGMVNGIRFYKATANSGVHVANLWTSGGTLLATATFFNETASGWQQVNFTTPVAITANTFYVASYHTGSGHYSDDQNYFAGTGVDNPPLHAPANGVSGFNGVYAYGSASSFPSQGWNSSNYWVDVVFSSSAPIGTLTSIMVTPVNPTIEEGAVQQFTATGAYSGGSNIDITGQVTWFSSNTSVATVNSSGLATAAAPGAAAISASLGGISGGTTLTITARTAGPEPAGWYAGDMHVHRSCGGAPEEISGIFTKMNPQNLTAVSLLADMGNGEVRDPVTDLPRVNGQDDPVSTAGRILHWDAEWHWDPTYTQYPHQALGGHVVALGVSEAHQIWEEYTYPIFTWAHQAGGIAGFVHMQYLDNGIPQSLNCCTPVEYPVETALGASDFIAEDVVDANATWSGMDPESAVKAYYRLLNCGFRPGFAAGTDYPCNGGGDLGTLLTYVQVAGGQMTYRNWIDGIAKGRAVVSRNGHNEFIGLTVNGSYTPGDEIKLTGGGSVQAAVQWTANQNLSGTIELVKNGVVVAGKQASVTSTGAANLNATVDFAHSGWLAARRMGSNGHAVHTAAVYVTVDNAPVRASAADAQFYVQWMDNLLQKTSPGGTWSSYFVNSRDAAQSRYRAAKALYQQIALEAAALENPLTINTTSLPGGKVNAPYSATLSASGGSTPYNWAITSGSLPAGLSLNAATGVISGTPTAGGAFNFSVLVSDSGSPVQTAARALNITVTVVTLSSITVTPANPSILNGATQQFTATGTYSDESVLNITVNVTWVSSSSAVAAINSTGLATALSPGTTAISATLDAIAGSTNLTVLPLPLKITTNSLPSGSVRKSYSATLAASGGTIPYKWSIASGSLPPGLSLNAGSGLISGTPAVVGSFSFTVRATDSGSPAQAVTKAFNIRIRK